MADGPDAAQLERERVRQQAEKDALAKAQRERALKRATVLTNTIRKFLASWASARQAEVDAARALAAAKANRKKGRKKAPKKKEAPAAVGKDGKKKAVKTPVAESWSGFMTSLDELVNKTKRVILEDMYRGVELLEPSEVVAFRRVLASANKKVLPTAGMNLNQLNIKEAIFSAASAHSYVHEHAAVTPSMGLAAMRDRGLSAKQLLILGFKESDLLRAGFTQEEVIEASHHEPAKLHAAGVPVAALVAHGAPATADGYRGVAALRQAGYGAGELVQAGLDNAWDLHRAGFTLSEVVSAGVPPEELRPAGFGAPELQPASFLAPSVAAVQGFDARMLPMHLEGTRSDMWRRLTAPHVPTLALDKAGGRAATLRATAAGGGSSGAAGNRSARVSAASNAPVGGLAESLSQRPSVRPPSRTASNAASTYSDRTAA